MVTTTSETTGPRRRMLFLHGQFFPPDCYQEKLATSWFDTAEKGGWDCVCALSPRVCVDEAPGVVNSLFPALTPQDMREWINSRTNEDGSKTYNRLQESMSFLQEFLKEQPRFDAITGHSNGALMASILTLLMESDDNFVPSDKKWSGTILFNAPASYETEVTLKKSVDQHGTVQTPSIHVFGGEMDITWEGQQKMKNVHHPTGHVIQHEAGHFFPTEQKYYDDILKALNEMVASSVE